MAHNSKPEQRKSNVEGLRASGSSAENEDIEDELLEEDEADDGQGMRAAGAQQDDDEDEVTESPASQRASVQGELGQGRQAASEREGRGGRNARGR